MTMIQLRNISKSYQHQGAELLALDDVSLHIARGEIFGIVGQSGAGKSTLVRCINLLEKPTRGKIFVDNQCISDLNAKDLIAARHHIGMIFQHFNLLAQRDVFANIALPLELAGMKKPQIAAKVAPLLALTGLEDKAHFYPAQLSGGQKQRVAIARALANEPKVLLCDEATSALDPKTTDAILALLKDINRQLGVTMVVITHEMDVVKAICDQVALLEAGQVVEVGSVGDFFANPQSPLGKKFVQQSQNFELPAPLLARLGQKSAGALPIIKLVFHGKNVDAPVISALTRQFGVDVNLIQAKVEYIGAHSFGFLLAELSGSDQECERALAYLNTLPLKTEVLGYVQAAG